jgi:DNA-binding response OmpR family regulator
VRILVVDVETRQLDTLCRGLFVCGHDAAPAPSAEEATRLLAAQAAPPFDLVVTDVRAPDHPGVALVARVRELAPSLPVLVITGLADAARLASIRGLGTAVLVKPFTPDELDVAVRAVGARAHHVSSP